MSSTLTSPAVSQVLGRLHRLADAEDEPARQRIRDREAQLGERLAQPQRYELYGDAPLAISREVAQLLYLLALNRGAPQIVEFGTSLGLSTIYLAAAVRDCGEGQLITCESNSRKALRAQEHLDSAGLNDLVELRLGDALQTLKSLTGTIDLLFLDGRNDLYLPVLALVEPHLAQDALIVADLSANDPDLLPYLEHVRDPQHRYFSICLPLDDGVELSVRMSG